MQEALQGLLLVAITGLIWALVGVIFSYVARQKLVLVAFMFVSSFCNCLYAWLFLFKPDSIGSSGGGKTPHMIAVMALAGILGAAGFQLMGNAMRRGNRGVIWALSQCAMMLPLLAAVVFFGEAPRAANWAGAAAILAGMALLAVSKTGKHDAERFAKNWLLMAYGVFLVVGASLTLTTLPSQWSDFKDAANLRLPVAFSASALYLLTQTLSQGMRSFTGRTVLLGLLYSVIVFTGQVFLYKSLDTFALIGKVGVVYPIATGICVVLFSIYSVVFLKEELKGSLLAGMIAISCGIFLLAL